MNNLSQRAAHEMDGAMLTAAGGGGVSSRWGLPESSVGVRRDAGRARIVKVREQMEQQSLDLLVVYGGGYHGFMTPNLCWWVSGLRQIGRDALAVVPLDGDPVVLATPRWDEDHARLQSWIDDVRPTDDIGAVLAGLVAERGWSASRVGTAGLSTASKAAVESIVAPFDTAPVPADAVIVTVGSAHDAWGLACIERAVEIAEAGYHRMLEVAQPGVPEFEVAAEINAVCRQLGADDNFLLVSASQYNRAPHQPTNRELAVGDVLLGEISPSVDGQFAQICRAVTIGPASDRHLADYQILQDGFVAGLNTAGPGVPIRDVAAAIDDVIAEAGFGEYNSPQYTRTRGHAMGFGPLVPPDISVRAEGVLRSGMSFVLHPNQYLPNTGYYLCGDQLVITDDGARALSKELPALNSIEVAVTA